MGEQPLPDLAAREARGLPFPSRAAQDTQDIELRCAQTVRFEKLGDVVAEGESQTLKAQIDLVLEARELSRRAGSGGGQNSLLSKTC